MTSSSGSNTIEVHRGEIGVTDACCPNKICVNTDFISSPVLPIVCLPNELVIRISSSEAEADISDAVAH